MTGDNVGLINNTAEITKAENSENIKDRDSIPNNRENKEDDFSSADVLLGIRTGENIVYVTLGIIIMIILSAGIFVIDRKVLREGR